MNVTDISRESVEKQAAYMRTDGYAEADVADMLLALLSAKEQAEGACLNWANMLQTVNAERDALKALCGELIAKHEKVVAWLIRYAEMHEKAAKDTRFQSLAVADVKAAANYRATAADIQPLLTRARSLL